MSEENVPSLYTDKLKDAIESIPQELYLLSEEALRVKVNPTLKLHEVKRAFWEELELAGQRSKAMRTWRIYDGKVSKSYFYEKILTDPAKMAWITSPLDSYEDKTKAALDMATRRYEDLLTMDIYVTKKRKDKETGEWEEYKEVCPKLAMTLLQVIKNLEDRRIGTAIQRQVNIHTTEPAKKTKAELSLDMVEERLLELEEQIGGIGDTGKNNKVRVLREDGSSDEREDGGDSRYDSIATSSRLVESDTTKQNA